VAVAQVLLGGTLTVSPPPVVGTTVSASTLGTIPGGTTQVALGTSPNPKPSAKQARGYKTNTSAFGTYVALSGVGATDNVTTADTLYLKSDAPLQVQLTVQNTFSGGGGTSTIVVPLYGTIILEFPAGGYCTAIAVAGNGDLEYVVSGPA
jgi:hypothetical protein